MPDDIVTRLRELVSMDSASHEPHTDGYSASAHHCLACFDIVTKEGAADEIERLRADIARYAEIVRIKDDLINAQVRKIMHLSGVKG